MVIHKYRDIRIRNDPDAAGKQSGVVGRAVHDHSVLSGTAPPSPRDFPSDFTRQRHRSPPPELLRAEGLVQPTRIACILLVSLLQRAVFLYIRAPSDQCATELPSSAVAPPAFSTTRRFWGRPCGVSFGAIASGAPKPCAAPAAIMPELLPASRKADETWGCSCDLDSGQSGSRGRQVM
jgi:hypothetical protein